MFLSQLIEKEIRVGNTVRGVVKGVGISLKSYEVKYLLCAGLSATRPSFAISIRSVTDRGDYLSIPRLRPLLPKYCACIFFNLPIYSFEGEYLGELNDLTINNFVATSLSTNKDTTFPISSIAACTDAILLKKEQPYPIGQRIPAPLLPQVTNKADGVVTKPILRAAIQKSSLIKLTLSLPPFFIESI